MTVPGPEWQQYPPQLLGSGHLCWLPTCYCCHLFCLKGTALQRPYCINIVMKIPTCTCNRHNVLKSEGRVAWCKTQLIQTWPTCSSFPMQAHFSHGSCLACGKYNSACGTQMRVQSSCYAIDWLIASNSISAFRLGRRDDASTLPALRRAVRTCGDA